MTSSQNIFSTWHPSPSDQPPPKYNNHPNRNSLHTQGPNSTSTNEFLPCTRCFFQNSGILTKCEHRVLCTTCAQDYVKDQIRKGTLPKCLVQSCKNATIDQEGLVSKFSQETQKRLKTVQLKFLLQRQERIQTYGQIPNSEGYIDKYTENHIISSDEHCPLCRRPSHKGECLRVTYLGEDLTIKTCKACNGQAYQQGGHGRVTCPNCHKQICYECGESWSFQHHSCQQGGWLKMPWNILKQCCSSSPIDEEKNTERIM